MWANVVNGECPVGGVSQNLVHRMACRLEGIEPSGKVLMFRKKFFNERRERGVSNLHVLGLPQFFQQALKEIGVSAGALKQDLAR